MTRRFTVPAMCAAVLCALAASPGAVAVSADAAAEDVRGLWVLRTSLTSADSIQTMVRAAANGGFNTLLVQVRGRGEAFYRSDLEPRASDLDRQPAAFDPLATVIASAHAAGLKVHAWVNVNLVASGTTLPRSRDHVALRHPDWLMAPRGLAATLRGISPRSPAYLGTLSRWTRAASEQVEGLYLSPVLPASREYSASVVREIVERYAVDGLHLDYVRFPNAEFDYGPRALAEFRAVQAKGVAGPEARRLDRAAVADPSAWATAYAAQWADFRRARLTLLVRRLADVARAARPGVTISAAVVPDSAEARDERFQDWLGWMRGRVLDVACPMIYTTDASEFGASVARLTADLAETPFWAGIGAFRLPVRSTIDHVRLARKHGASGVLLFSYDRLSDAGTTATGFAALRPVLLGSSNGSGRPK